MDTVLGDCHWPVPTRIAPSAHRITMVRTNVAKSEFTFSTPIFAKMAVSAANPADRTAQSCQETSADFIDGPHGIVAQGGLMPEKVLRRCEAFTNLYPDGDGVPR